MVRKDKPVTCKQQENKVEFRSINKNQMQREKAYNLVDKVTS